MQAPLQTQAPPRRRAAATPLPMMLRRLHGWLGALFAPAVIFFAASGLLQVFDLHKPQSAQGYRPPAVVKVIAALHKNQTLRVKDDAKAARDAARPGKKKGGDATARPGPEAGPQAKAAPARATLGETLLKAYAAATSVVLAAISLLGLYLALCTPRDRVLNLALLALGVLAPIGLMLLA